MPSLRRSFRKFCRQVHLLLSLLVGLVVICVAVSGSLIVFKAEIRGEAKPTEWDVSNDIGWQKARDVARAHHPTGALQILWFPNQLRPYYEAAYLTEGESFTHYVRIHPTSGEVTPSPEADWLEWVEVLHINLHLGDFGHWLVKWSVLLFVLVLVSGLFLWWPGWRPHLWFKIRNKGKLLNYDLHRVFGVVSAPILILMSLLGFKKRSA